MEKLLQQIRDNQRFENWCCFPDNSIQYSYNNETGAIEKIIYLRKDIPEFFIEHLYYKDKLVVKRFVKVHHDGTDNL